MIKFYENICLLFSPRLTSYTSEMITWENFFPVKQDPGRTKEGSHLARMKFFSGNRKIYSL